MHSVSRVARKRHSPGTPTPYYARVDFTLSLTPDLVAVFLTLFVLEVVLGIDNVVFISILASKLPSGQQARARNVGLTLAMVMRVGLVFLAGWIISLKEDILELFGQGFSVKDFILIAGGLFLVYKAVHEIHLARRRSRGQRTIQRAATFKSVLVQILLLDLVFSLDSVITAVGMTSNMLIIVTVVVLSFGIMLFASRFVFAFVNRHPTVKMLALSFLLLIGVFLVADGFGIKIDKAMIYGPMAFAILVEALNLLAAARKARQDNITRTPVALRPSYPGIDESVAVAAPPPPAPTRVRSDCPESRWAVSGRRACWSRLAPYQPHPQLLASPR